METLSAMQGFIVIGVIIGIGYLAARANVGGPTAQMVLQRFAFFVATPCLMFTLISKENLADVATYILDDPAAVTPIVLMQQVIFTPMALTALDISTTGKSSFAATAKQLAHQPILIGVLCGIIVSAASAGTGVFLVPQFLYDPLNIVGQAAVPLIMCAFGMSLRGARPLANREGRQATITAAALKNAFMPAVAFALASALGFTGHNLYACVVLAALPSAQNVFNYAARYNAGTTFARDGVLLSTICSPVCILAIALLLN